MPIKPENRARYPKNWRAIVARIRDRARNKCEKCGVPNGADIFRDAAGEWHPCAPDGSKGPQPVLSFSAVERLGFKVVRIVCTTAHLGHPAQLPVQLRVAAPTQADQVLKLICFVLPLEPEVPEWNHMMYDRALSEFKRGPSATPARFVISLPRGSAGLVPRPPISHLAPTVAPELILLTDWRLIREPRETAGVRTEASAGAEIVPADRERFTAAFANALAEPALLDATAFIATGRRADDLVVGSLLRRERKCDSADDAFTLPDAYSWSRHDAILYHFGEYPENCDPANLRYWCQRCHLAYDHDHHQRNARDTRRRGRALGDLFEASK